MQLDFRSLLEATGAAAGIKSQPRDPLITGVDEFLIHRQREPLWVLPRLPVTGTAAGVARRASGSARGTVTPSDVEAMWLLGMFDLVDAA